MTVANTRLRSSLSYKTPVEVFEVKTQLSQRELAA